MESPMTISQLIARLEGIKRTFGDVAVGTWQNDGVYRPIYSVKLAKGIDRNGNVYDKCAWLRWEDFYYEESIQDKTLEPSKESPEEC